MMLPLRMFRSSYYAFSRTRFLTLLARLLELSELRSTTCPMLYRLSSAFTTLSIQCVLLDRQEALTSCCEISLICYVKSCRQSFLDLTDSIVSEDYFEWNSRTRWRTYVYTISLTIKCSQGYTVLTDSSPLSILLGRLQILASEELQQELKELSKFMKVRLERDSLRMTTVEWEKMEEEGEREEELSEQLLSLVISFLSRFFRRMNTSRVSVSIISGISVVILKGESNSSTQSSRYVH